jgi:hypothetical protein
MPNPTTTSATPTKSNWTLERFTRQQVGAAAEQQGAEGDQGQHKPDGDAEAEPDALADAALPSPRLRLWPVGWTCSVHRSPSQ